MSDPASASAGRKARTSAIILIVALIVFSSIVVVLSNQLGWPLAAEEQSLKPHPIHLNNNNTQSSSSLVVTAFSYAPEINGSGYSNYTSHAVDNATVDIYRNYQVVGKKNALVATGLTDVNGEQSFVIPPGNYSVEFTSTIGAATIPATVSSGNTTELDIRLNETSHLSTFFETSDSVSTHVIAPWDTVFLSFYTTSSIIQSTNLSVFLSFESRQGNSTAQSQLFGVRVLTDYFDPVAGSEWLQVQLKSVANITDVTGVMVVTYQAFYSTREYPFEVQTTTTTFATG